MRYQGTIIRPFSEADSYLLQCTLGCSHNQCTFCGTYKDKSFRIRPLQEIKEDIRMARQHLGDARKVFLCDGDAIAMPTDMLLAILKELYAAFDEWRALAAEAAALPVGATPAGALELQRVSRQIGSYLGQHINKEDNVLLPMCHRFLPPAALEEVGAKMKSVP